MAVISRSFILALLSGLGFVMSTAFSDDQTLKRVEELLVAADFASPHRQLVTRIFSSMADWELAEMVVDSPSMSLRLRAAEELALRREDRHPCETFLELVGGVLDVTVPPRAQDAIRHGVPQPAGGLAFIDGEIRPLMRGGATSIEDEAGGWSVTFQRPRSLVVKVAGRRHEVAVPYQRPTVAAGSEDGVMVCSLYEPYGDSPPLSVAFSAQTGEEIWRRENLAPGKPVLPRGLRQDIELVIQGDRVYLFGVCSQSMFIECFLLSDGRRIGGYRSRSALIFAVPAQVLKPAADR
ncbi:hypothetical protein [Planctomyces sp. SH-PL14]|uniref:hypothetical protein n=1 Tax=Planctomyces sp. SH-PL14 TaxID=1632864 RepID=UPI00078D0B1A|nr:hypothetical protein [Planctomyces sp. SH-PL14]AMV16949.1 hypothetical protein VT03_03605 [Planctomyces sp. SH-PL14]